MKIHSGTEDGRPARWIEIRETFQLNLDEMIDGLCSKHVRDYNEDSPELPAEMSMAKMINDIKAEYHYWGTANTWTWSDQCLYPVNEAREWARQLILSVLPELEV